MGSREYEKLLQVSREVGLPLRKILDMFSWLKDAGSVENNELLRNLGVSRNVLNQVKEGLSSFFEPPSLVTALSSQGKSNVEKISRFLGMKEELILNFDNQKIEQIIKLLERYKGERPISERKFDQFTATLETTARRACLMEFFADIREKRILFLGDDDFTSLGVASFRSAQKIQVLDIDKRVFDGISQVSSKEGLEILTASYDAFGELSRSYRGNFDIVFTDPPYTSDGIALFLSRAIDALDLQNQATRIYFCYGNSDRAKERFLPIYEVIINSGLMMRWVFDKFNRYEGAESIGSTSSLFICDITPKTKALIKGNFNGEIYTND